MKERSPLRRFFTIARRFGAAVALVVAYEKVRGVLWPELALPDKASYDARRRELTIFLRGSDITPETLDVVVRAVIQKEGAWEICICEHPPMAGEILRDVQRLRGSKPWIRVVAADGVVKETIATRWTAEQATGKFAMFVAPGVGPSLATITGLLACLRAAPKNDSAAAVISSLSGLACVQALVVRKSTYLSLMQGCWDISAPAVAEVLQAACLPVVEAGTGECFRRSLAPVQDETGC